jgi:hypothetical protein
MSFSFGPDPVPEMTTGELPGHVVPAAARAAIQAGAVVQEAKNRQEQDRQRAAHAMHMAHVSGNSLLVVTDPFTAAWLRWYQAVSQGTPHRIDDNDRKILGLPSLEEELAGLKLQLATTKRELGQDLSDEELALLATQNPQETP